MEFVHYYDAHKDKVAQSSHWDHSPEEFRMLRQQDESMRRRWEERVIDVWKELEANPATPMSFVSWYEAVAYARWRTQRYRAAGAISKDAIVRLPTAEEWAVIAGRSHNGAKFPWGNNRQDASYGNWRKTGIGAPTAPGTFPESANSGLYDFGTNLRAWSHSNSKRGLEWPPVGPTNELYFATLGGSYRSKLDQLGANTSPEYYSPTDRKKSVGIRLVLQENG
jgi:formylglycine-generating enzyme required for sulfatase activity